MCCIPDMCHTCPSVANSELCELEKKNYPVLRTLVPRPTSHRKWVGEPDYGRAGELKDEIDVIQTINNIVTLTGEGMNEMVRSLESTGLVSRKTKIGSEGQDPSRSTN